jgi:myo-inositol-1-phosphate synthase
MSKIKVAIIGVGNCAKSLVEGIQYYIENPDDKVGLMYSDIGGYTVNDIEFVCGFDVDIRKVNHPLKDALRALPNCAMDHVFDITEACVSKDAMVYSGPLLDGVADHMLDYPEEVSFRIGAIPAEPFDRVVDLLKYHKVDVIINYLPVGSEEATKFYVDAAIKAKCHFINCIPTLIDYEVAQEVEQIIPDLVQEDSEGTKVLHYQNLTAVLVEAIKEQQEQINTLKQTVQELSTKLENCCP